MGMLNFFNNMADKMRKPPSEFDNYLNELDKEYGTNTLGFIEQHFQPAQTAEMIDSADLMAQTNSMAGILNPAQAMLESNATAAQASTPALYDPRSDNLPAGMLADPEAETPEQRKIREGYEGILETYPVSQYQSNQPLKVYG